MKRLLDHQQNDLSLSTLGPLFERSLTEKHSRLEQGKASLKAKHSSSCIRRILQRSLVRPCKNSYSSMIRPVEEAVNLRKAPPQSHLQNNLPSSPLTPHKTPRPSIQSTRSSAPTVKTIQQKEICTSDMTSHPKEVAPAGSA